MDTHILGDPHKVYLLSVGHASGWRGWASTRLESEGRVVGKVEEPWCGETMIPAGLNRHVCPSILSITRPICSPSHAWQPSSCSLFPPYFEHAFSLLAQLVHVHVLRSASMAGLTCFSFIHPVMLSFLHIYVFHEVITSPWL
jgi:hypothetical protein